MLGHLEYDFISKQIFLSFSLHEPIPVNTKKVESVETLINSNKISPISELLNMQLFLVFTKVFQANCTSTSYSIVILS